MVSNGQVLGTGVTTAAPKQTLQTLLQRYATVVTIVTSAVVALSGVMIFFHLGEKYVKEMHEWLGLVFVLAALAHVLRHIKPFMILISKPRTKIAAALAALVVVGFVGAGSLAPSGGNPMKQFVDLSANAPISALAQVTGEPISSLVNRLEQSGIARVTAEKSLSELAHSTGRNPAELFRLVLQGQQVR